MIYRTRLELPHIVIITHDMKEVDRLNAEARQRLTDEAEQNGEFIVWNSLKVHPTLPGLIQGEVFILEVESAPKRWLLQSPKKTL